MNGAADTTPLTTPEPVDVWYDDGTLIVQAEEKLFRVYGGLLSAASPVFRDMFSLPQADTQVSVVLQDSAADTSYFLKAIHDLNFFLPPPAPIRLEVLVGILRLSTKYDVPYLRRCALTHLSLDYPTTLSEYEAIKERPSSILQVNLNRHISVINLARELNISWIIPSAMYYIASATLPEFYDFIDGDNQQPGLSKKDKKTCILGATLAKEYGFLQILSIMNREVEDDCADRDGCAATKNADIRNTESWYVVASDLLGRWYGWIYGELCCPCRKSAMTAHQFVRKAFWLKLPGIFGCAPWEELANDKDKALLSPY